MTNQKPTVGRIVHYCLTVENADAINRRRTDGDSVAERLTTEPPQWPAGAQAHIGDRAYAGGVYPMVITRVWGETVNGQVILDGNDVLWVTSVRGEEEGAPAVPGHYSWPVRDDADAAADGVPKLESRVDLRRTATQPEKEGLAATVPSTASDRRCVRAATECPSW